VSRPDSLLDRHRKYETNVIEDVVMAGLIFAVISFAWEPHPRVATGRHTLRSQSGCPAIPNTAARRHATTPMGDPDRHRSTAGPSRTVETALPSRSGMVDHELRKEAHDLDVTVWVGKSGIGAVTDELGDQLDDRKLVKVKFLRAARGSRDTEELAEELAERVDAELVETRGNTAVLT